MKEIEEEIANPKHADYGMFILVVMSHGADKDQIYGSDMNVVKLQHIYDLLSPSNFPCMSGKPKVVIVQACAGGKAYIE